MHPVKMRLLAIVAPAILHLACTSPVPSYPGERRTPNETALLKSDADISILQIDGRAFNGRMFEILPGKRSLRLKVALGGEDLRQSASARRKGLICDASFEAVAGRAYRVTRTRPEDLGRSESFSERRAFHVFQLYFVDLIEEREVQSTAGFCAWRR